MYRNNNRNRNNNQGGGNYNNGNYGGSISRGGGGGGGGGNINPWNNNMDNNQGGNRGNQDAISFLQNIFRGGNQGNIPSLFENMANGFNRGGGGGGGNGPVFNRGGGGGRNNNLNNNRRNNNSNNNRIVKGAIRKPNRPNNNKTMPHKKNSNKSNDSVIDSNNSTNNKNNEASRTVTATETSEKEGKRKISPYADVPNDMFYCHLCAKHMWDSTSFENHLKGRTHQMMKDGVEESYHMKANMLRQEGKIAEQLKSIEIDRLKRLGKQIRAANQVREYCAMCDLHFYGHLSTHRKSDGHLELKKFLHPKCDDCTTEFHNRAEYDSHLLSPEHMKTCKTPPSYKSDESRRNRLQILTEADELQGLREEKPKKEKGAEEGATEDGEKKEGEAMETEANEGNEEETKAEEEEPETEPILDFKDGDEIGPEIENKIPKYNCKRQVGNSLVSKLTCFECHICNKYFDNEKTAEIHTRTFNHHRMFVKFLNEKANEIKIAQKRAAAAAAEEDERQKRIKLDDEAKEKEEGGENELYDPLEAQNDADGAKEEIADETMNEVAENALEKEAEVAEDAKVEEEKVEDAVKEEETPATPATPATPNSQNTTPNKQQNNRGGRGRGGRRGGRYGNRF